MSLTSPFTIMTTEDHGRPQETTGDNNLGYKTMVITGTGGVLGATSRYYLSGLVRHENFPYGTLLVNVIGCLILGFLIFSSLYQGYFSDATRNFIAIGLPGSFTTMSTFSYETVHSTNPIY